MKLNYVGGVLLTRNRRNKQFVLSKATVHCIECNVRCNVQHNAKCKMKLDYVGGVVLTRARRNKQFVPPPFPSLRQRLNGVTFFPLAMQLNLNCSNTARQYRHYRQTNIKDKKQTVQTLQTNKH